MSESGVNAELTERLAEIRERISEVKPSVFVTGAVGGGWGYEIATSKTVTLHSCKNGCGFYVEKSDAECMTCSAKYLLERLDAAELKLKEAELVLSVLQAHDHI